MRTARPEALVYLMTASLVVAGAAGAVLVPSAVRRRRGEQQSGERVSETRVVQPAPASESSERRSGPVPQRSKYGPTLRGFALRTALVLVAVAAGAAFVPGVSVGTLLSSGPDAVSMFAIVGEVAAWLGGAGDPAALAASALRIWVALWIVDCALTMLRLVMLQSGSSLRSGRVVA